MKHLNATLKTSVLLAGLIALPALGQKPGAPPP